MKIFVTGATGFVGSELCRILAAHEEYDIIATSRKDVHFSDQIEILQVEDLESVTDWQTLLAGVDVIIHAAARAHVMNETEKDPLEVFRRINVVATINMAKAAVEAGVKRFIFLSSVKVNGESTVVGEPFNACDTPNPSDPYGISKLEAEQGLLDLVQKSALEVVIIRPPLVYGKGVKANFAALAKVVRKGLPLPLGCFTENKRSMVFLGNLISFIEVCITHPAAANNVWLVSDDHDLSTADLIKQMGIAMSKRARLFPVPLAAFSALLACINKKPIFQRLAGSLQLDISKSKELLEWNPPFSVTEGFEKTLQTEKSTEPVVSSEALRLLDLILAASGVLVLWPLLLLVTILGYCDTGSPLFLQKRVGKNKKAFTLVKFRTMEKGTASVASHLVGASTVTPFGKFLRKTKIDELPQLFNVLNGDMSLVGPRPNLFNQQELINERDVRGVYDVLPGITGLAQINNIDMSTPALLAEVDKDMIQSLTFWTYFKYIIATAFGKGVGDVVK